MTRIVAIWLAGAIFLGGFSIGFDEGCGNSASVKNPLIFLFWPAAVVAIAFGWESDKINKCDK